MAYLSFMASSLTDLGELGEGMSPGGGELASSSIWLGDAGEVGVMDSVSSSPSNLSPSSGEPSSPPSPEKERKPSRLKIEGVSYKIKLGIKMF